jgi:hypothetical protein
MVKADFGTLTTIARLVQDEAFAVAPPNFTTPEVPKPVPRIVTLVPAAPCLGDNERMCAIDSGGRVDVVLVVGSVVLDVVLVVGSVVLDVVLVVGSVVLDVVLVVGSVVLDVVLVVGSVVLDVVVGAGPTVIE